MFSSRVPFVFRLLNMCTGFTGDTPYDFSSSENSAKWKGLLTADLRKVLEQVHPSLGAKEGALDYIESLCFRLLGMLCDKPGPHCVKDVETRIENSFPYPIDNWALAEARDAINRGKKKTVLQLPVDKIHNLVQKEILLYKVDSSVTLFMVAVIEYISADILKLVGNYTKNIKNTEITYQDVQISMKVDKALMDMFYQDEGGGSSLNEKSIASTSHPNVPYHDVVKEFITSEKAYMRELHLVVKVFREEILKLNPSPEDMEQIFSSIMDIYELTYSICGSVEDIKEYAEEQCTPIYLGTCFEELAEIREFDVYLRYAYDVTSPVCRDALNKLLSRPDVQSTLNTAGQGMALSLKYYLPALLIGPIWRCLYYLDVIKMLHETSPSKEDKEILKQTDGIMTPLEVAMRNFVLTHTVPKNAATLFQGRPRGPTTINKLQELDKIVENWDSTKLSQCCIEFLREDVLLKVSSSKRLTERRVFLFDGLMALCKPNLKRQSSLHPECRLKEKLLMRRVTIIDHEDTDELKNAFEIAPRQMPSVILCAKSPEHKNSWMADLVMLNNRSMLDRVLDSILADIDKKHPLKLPPPELYKFSEPDSDQNIVIDDEKAAPTQPNQPQPPLIKGATIYKLIERLTYHVYADPKFVRTFLTTFRTFCTPNELLNLIIERFQIPDPSLVYEPDGCDTDKMQKNNQREDWKKYRKEFCQPVQFRSLNVLRHWVDHHFDDFEKDPDLLLRLQMFLDSVHGKGMKKWVDSVKKIIERKKLKNDNPRPIAYAFDTIPPPIERHINCSEEEYCILTLHPVEFARQLTMLEFDIYRTIMTSEIVGSVWTKKDKEKTSPNLLKMIKHTTNITRWMEKNIVEAQNLEERVAIVNRIIEIMMCLVYMNNFNGVLAIVSATGSAAVHRLKFTFANISQSSIKFLEEYRLDDHLKKYQEKLRSINPPCVPFLGSYLTNILHLEEGNPHIVPNTKLINFFKWRKVAELLGEIQQYQNQPYCYHLEPTIRHFLENINPFGDMGDTDISNYLYQKSLEIEPRGGRICQKFPRKWPHLSLKSPGIKAAKPTDKEKDKDKDKDKDRDKDKDKNQQAPAAITLVQLGGTGQSSPTLSPISPAASNHISNTFNHTRSPSVGSTSFRPPRAEPILSTSQYIPQRYSHASQSSTGDPTSPGPHSPASPAPYFPTMEPISPHLPPTPPPPPHVPSPPPLPPRRRRDSPEISSPQQMKQAPDAPILPPRDSSAPPLPPRREPATAPSPNSHSHSHHSLPNTSPNTGHGTLPNSNVGHGTLPNPNIGHGTLPKPNVGHGTLPKPNMGHGTLPNPHMGHGTLPKPNMGHGALSNHTLWHGTLPNSNVGHGPLPNPPIGHDTLQNPNKGHGTLPHSDVEVDTLPLLDHPTHLSHLHIRRHAAPHPHPQHSVLHNGGTSILSASHPPKISPRFSASDSASGQITPQLPPRPALRSAEATCGTMFQYPSVTKT